MKGRPFASVILAVMMTFGTGSPSFAPTVPAAQATPVKAAAKVTLSRAPLVSRSAVRSERAYKVYAFNSVMEKKWSSVQFVCLDELWTHESHWNPKAHNSSGAHGIAQALPASKMASAGSDYMTSGATQIDWGIKYITGRYKTPCGAWKHFQRYHWY